MTRPWRGIDTCPPYRTVELYRATDLFPVVGFGMPGPIFMLEEGGPEDGEHRQYPILAYQPTHWRDLPDDLPKGSDGP